MAVEVKYVVVRKGEEKMTFASKKEADAYDKMLDMAEVFSDWLVTSNTGLEEHQFEALGMYLAENKDAVQHILRTSKMPEATSDDASVADNSAAADESAADSEQGKSKPVRAVKAA
ncbi:YebG family protein [Erwiniaceae bacterium BAC15a-03b]|uniref:YebG family protein n=1 Tax=Winslowiella arboricola TaxID=2978220 RepID=A0A9J6PWN7_9GAMM|nr:YebG family protein [Winslowiella arboricola]MCU5775881.1 YebG family protein [Winslowiella arboricola]MCU5779268.1 YebG family protein [Winslowiella arboricola]